MNAISRTEDDIQLSAMTVPEFMRSGQSPDGAIRPLYGEDGLPKDVGGDYDWIGVALSNAEAVGTKIVRRKGCCLGIAMWDGKNYDYDVSEMLNDALNRLTILGGVDVQVGCGRRILSIRVRPADGKPAKRFREFDGGRWPLSHFDAHLVLRERDNRDLTREEMTAFLRTFAMAAVKSINDSVRAERRDA